MNFEVKPFGFVTISIISKIWVKEKRKTYFSDKIFLISLSVVMESENTYSLRKLSKNSIAVSKASSESTKISGTSIF